MAEKSSSSPDGSGMLEAVAHPQSGLLFPKKVGPFGRGEVRNYDGAGYDVSVGYNTPLLSEVQVSLTFYIYPHVEKPVDAAALLSGHFAELKDVLRAKHPGMKPEGEGRNDISVAGEALEGRMFLFSNDEVFVFRKQAVLSELRLFVWKKWFIKYRITYPKEAKEKAQALIGAFLREFPQTASSGKG